MNTTTVPATKNSGQPLAPSRKSQWNTVLKNKYIYLMLIPGLVYILIFHYGPMFGLLTAFKDYKPFIGFWGSSWTLENFKLMFMEPTNHKFFEVLRNTVLISFYKVVFGFPAPILLALLLNEIKNVFFKRTLQTAVYLPHFISWIVTYSLMLSLLSSSDGLINNIISSMGMEPISFLGQARYFRGVLVISDIWKEVGWGAIIYLAALAGISPELYESAMIDGASKIQRVIYISLPCILPTITVMLILRMGSILNAGFEQVFALYNPAVYSTGDILDTFVYRATFTQGQYGFATAVGMFKSIIALAMMTMCNWFSQKVGQEGVF